MADRSHYGRRTMSWIAVALGVLSFFLPLISLNAPLARARISAYNVLSASLGISQLLSAEIDIYDIGAALLYGSDSSGTTAHGTTTGPGSS